MTASATPSGHDRPPHFTDDAWVEVLSAVDRTYADLVVYQEQLERQNAELQEMRTFLTAILSSVSDVLIVADRAGRVAQVSRSVGILTGGTESAALDQPLTQMFDPAQHDAIEALLQKVRDSRRSAQAEANLIAATGHEPLDISVAPRLDDRGRVDGFVLTGRPLGALRQAYAELSESHDALKTAQAQLVRNEKLASLGRLLAGVAHELNNPISFVYANAHALAPPLRRQVRDLFLARVQDAPAAKS
ncbi:MAG: histidine kinase dimerization/phospho-acceptor domain-containing protein [Paracoccaceae bacterium]